MKLKDAAKVVRSKNCGPYMITFDIIFKNKIYFNQCIESNTITLHRISKIYEISQENIVKIIKYPIANAIKITIIRPLAEGQPGERDIYGAQQHAPLLELEFYPSPYN